MTCCSCGEHYADVSSSVATSPSGETFEFCEKCTESVMKFMESGGAEKEMLDQDVPF